MKKILLFLITLTALVTLFSCNERKKYSTEIWGYFDTVTEVSGYFDSEEEFERAVECVKGVMRQYNELLDPYGDSELVNLKSVNESQGQEITVSRELFDFLLFFKSADSETHGACSMGIGRISFFWKEIIASDKPLPDKTALAEEGKHIGTEYITLDPEALTVRLENGVMIDPGAVAKGWVGEKIKEALSKEGLGSLIVNMGGHVIAIGEKHDGKAWTVGIRNPKGGSFTTVGVKDRSVVTSGVYERGRKIDGVLYHHIISPKTLSPVSHNASVTVICEDSALADALSTALFVTTTEDGLEILKDFPDVAALWIYPDGSFFKTDNFPE